MTNHPFSTTNRPIPFINAVAQCEKCKGTSSYDATDAYEGRELKCRSCGGRLKLYAQVMINGQTS